jgi:phytoene synthase
MSPDQYCRNRTGGASSDVFFCVLLSPARVRRGLTALHALEREVMDVAIQSTDADVAEATLRWWQGEVDALYQGEPRHPVTRALLPFVSGSNLAREYFAQLIEGATDDVRRHGFASFDELRVHIVHTAGAVAQLETAVLGATSRGSARFTHFLAQGSELARIIRHLGQHVRAGRLYLPHDDLDAFGVSDTDIMRARTSEDVARLLAFEVERCAALFREALTHLPPPERRALHPGLVRMALNLEVLAEIKADGYRVLERRTELTPLRKLKLAWRVRRRGGVTPAVGRKEIQ